GGPRVSRVSDPPGRVGALREEEREAARTLQRRAFNVPASAPAGPQPPPPLDSLRVAEVGGAIAGVLRVHRFGHFFAGRSVPALGIGGVAVAPEARGPRGGGRLVVWA